MSAALSKIPFLLLAANAVLLAATPAKAVSSAELYTTKSYAFGRFEARLRFAPGDGVVSSFFLWKNGSEVSGTFWNELDFEKLGADCHLETNAYFGNPAAVHSQKHALDGDLCGQFHTYAYEWTPDYIAWFVDGLEIRRETGATATAYSQNAADGMQIRFNVWPGDASFGGNFDPAILPVHEYIHWVQYSTYANGAFQQAWREDFSAGTLPADWATGNWSSPKNLSTHSASNVNILNGYAVLSLTADTALGATGAVPDDSGGTPITNPGGPAGGTETEHGGGCSLVRTRTGHGAGILLALGAFVAGLFGRRARSRR
jgi:hypothetical protein